MNARKDKLRTLSLLASTSMNGVCAFEPVFLHEPDLRYIDIISEKSLRFLGAASLPVLPKTTLSNFVDAQELVYKFTRTKKEDDMAYISPKYYFTFRNHFTGEKKTTKKPYWNEDFARQELNLNDTNTWRIAPTEIPKKSNKATNFTPKKKKRK